MRYSRHCARPGQHIGASEQAQDRLSPMKNRRDKQFPSWRSTSCHTDENRYSDNDARSSRSVSSVPPGKRRSPLTLASQSQATSGCTNAISILLLLPPFSVDRCIRFRMAGETGGARHSNHEPRARGLKNAATMELRGFWRHFVDPLIFLRPAREALTDCQNSLRDARSLQPASQCSEVQNPLQVW